MSLAVAQCGLCAASTSPSSQAATGFAPAAFGTLKKLFWGALGMEGSLRQRTPPNNNNSLTISLSTVAAWAGGDLVLLWKR